MDVRDYAAVPLKSGCTHAQCTGLKVASDIKLDWQIFTETDLRAHR